MYGGGGYNTPPPAYQPPPMMTSATNYGFSPAMDTNSTVDHQQEADIRSSPDMLLPEEAPPEATTRAQSTISIVCSTTPRPSSGSSGN